MALRVAVFGIVGVSSYDPPPTWEGHMCPAGVWWEDDTDPYGETGWDWEGEIVAVNTRVGNPQSCCQQAGGNGLAEIGLWYMLCNPHYGCHKHEPQAWGDKYFCTIYRNVTGRKPLPGGRAGFAQAPAEFMPHSDVVRSPEGTNYQNPFVGACKDNEDNVTVLGNHALSGAVCAPPCDPDLACPTDNMPSGTKAVPKCLLGVNIGGVGHPSDPWRCALTCDADSVSGGDGQCPAGATCKALYVDGTRYKEGQNPGVCTYDGPNSIIV